MLRLHSIIVLLFFAQMAVSQSYGLEKLNPAINSRDYDEISPKVSPDGKTLYFTRIGYPIYDKTLLINGQDWGTTGSYNAKLRSIFRSLGGQSTIDPERSDFNQDIWYATSKAGVFDKLTHATYPLNNALPNSVCSFSADGRSIYLINQFGQDGGMEPGFSRSVKRDGINWAFPEPLDINDFYTKMSGVHMSMSEDEKIVVMSLMRDDSYGGTDLYVSFHQGNNKYSVPINLGPDVNTEHNEEAPFICSDNKTMYFSSDRPGTYGGKDIYKAVRQDVTWESWDEPYPLAEPINSRKDDNQPFYHPGTGYLYFVSTRINSSDIYRVSYSEILQEKDPESTQYATMDPGPVRHYSTFSYQETTPPKRTISVNIIDAESGEPLNAKLKYIARGEESTGLVHNGRTSITVAESDLVLRATLGGYMVYDAIIPTAEVIEKSHNRQSLTIRMDALVENGKIYTDPIFFIQSKAAIKKESYPALNKLVRTLKLHWEVSILIEGHTDDQGTPDALVELSEKRAKAVKDYLIRKGISPLRVTTLGVGGAKPINDNSTDALRQKNRRVEIIISKIYQKGT